MITLAILSDKQVPGQRRAAGKIIRKIIAICVDNFNYVLAEGSDPAKLVGKKFVGNAVHLASTIEQYGLDVEYARKQMLEFWKRFSGAEVGNLSWAEMGEKFEMSKRRTDSSAVFILYDELKEKGWTDFGA